MLSDGGGIGKRRQVCRRHEEHRIVCVTKAGRHQDLLFEYEWELREDLGSLPRGCSQEITGSIAGTLGYHNLAGNVSLT